MTETFTCSYCKQTVPFSPSAMQRHQTNPSPDAIAPSCMATPPAPACNCPLNGAHSSRCAYQVWKERYYDVSRDTDTDYDPTPWCSGCNAMRKVDCKCGPIAENE